MQTVTKALRVGYNAETEKHVEYAPLAHGLDALAIAVRVETVFMGVECVFYADTDTLYCVSADADAARSASWYACGIASGATLL